MLHDTNGDKTHELETALAAQLCQLQPRIPFDEGDVSNYKLVHEDVNWLSVRRAAREALEAMHWDLLECK